MSEGSGVEVAELRQREFVGCEREADVRVRQLRPQSLAAGEDDRAVVERELGQTVRLVPRRVAGQLRIEVARDEAEVRRCQLPLVRHALRVAARLQLLEVR